jgi:hypothetical protein
MNFLDRVLDMEIKLGNYKMNETFYVVDLSNTDVVFGCSVVVLTGRD